MEFIDYYAVLGVASSADPKAIKAAYRKLARRYHPDLNKQPGAEEQFKQVAQAYEVLHKPESRAQYDEICLARTQRSAQARAAPGAGAAGYSEQQFADFFNSLFTQDSASEAPRRRNPFAQFEDASSPDASGDVEIEFPITLEDTLTDGTKLVSYSLPKSGPQGQPLHKSLKVNLRAGACEGDRIRLKGQGIPGIAGNPAGDAYLKLRLLPHPIFDLQGHHLLVTVPVAPWEAALGGKVIVPTLTASISLTIPPNSQAGQRLRIKGRGLLSKQGQGDLIALLKVVLPPHNSSKAQALWADLAADSHFNPRALWNLGA